MYITNFTYFEITHFLVF